MEPQADNCLVHHPLLQTCRQIYNEALSLYYTYNCFILSQSAIKHRAMMRLRRIAYNHGVRFQSLLLLHPPNEAVAFTIHLVQEAHAVVAKWVGNDWLDHGFAGIPLVEVCLDSMPSR